MTWNESDSTPQLFGLFLVYREEEKREFGSIHSSGGETWGIFNGNSVVWLKIEASLCWARPSHKKSLFKPEMCTGTKLKGNIAVPHRSIPRSDSIRETFIKNTLVDIVARH